MRRRQRRNIGSQPPPPEAPTPRPSTRRTAVSTDARDESSLAGADESSLELGGTNADDVLPPSSRTPKKKRHWAVRVLRAALVLLLASIALGSVALYLVLDHYSEGLPSVESLKRGYEPPQITRIFARDQTLLGSVFVERRTVIPFDRIPDAAKLSFLAAEDARFYEHEGLNYFGILRAFVANVRAGHMVQGGSTITQQVIKNVLLDSERSLRRKIREVLLVHRLEQSLTKDEIFWLYLNHIYLGHGRYGIEEASRFYFGKPTSGLTLPESATLAGLIAAPERYSPRRDPQKSLKRRAYVLDQMVKKGFVTPELYESVKDAPLHLAPTEEAESRLAPEVMNRARNVLAEALPGHADGGGFSVTTTIDPKLQAAGRQAVRDAIDAYLTRHDLWPPYTVPSRKSWPDPFVGRPKPYRAYTGIVQSSDDAAGTLDVKVGDTLGRVSLAAESRYNPKRLAPSAFAKPGAALRVSFPEVLDGDGAQPLRLELGPQGALVAIDVRTREVLALVGSYEGVTAGLDRATQTKRQPGSSFKPLMYSYALHTGQVTPATVLTVKQRGHGVAPEGPPRIALRAGVAHSNNEVATQVMRQVGPKGVVEWAHALGIQSELKPDLSLALGSYEVSPLELTNAFVAFANGGNVGVPRFVSKITLPSGSEVPLPVLPPERRVLSEDEAYLTTSLLRSVIQSGTARSARSLDRDAAGKTGTTNDVKDTWFVGYTTDIVVGVWIGFDDPTPLGNGESGAKTALPAWTSFMKVAHEGRPKTGFARTPGVLTLKLDPKTGLLPAPGQEDLVEEEFLRGTEPTEVAPFDAGAPPPLETSSPAPEARPAEPSPEPELPPF